MLDKFGKGTLGAGFSFIFAGVYDVIQFPGRVNRGLWTLAAGFLSLEPAGYSSLTILDAVEDETPTITVSFDQTKHLEKMRELIGLLREAGELVVDDSELAEGELKLQPPLDWRDREPFPFPPIEADGASSVADNRLMRGVES